MLTLYNANISTCSRKVRMALREKGLEWQDWQMDLLAGDQLSDWYLAINPNGVVPTLVHDDTMRSHGGPGACGHVGRPACHDRLVRPRQITPGIRQNLWPGFPGNSPHANNETVTLRRNK